MATNTNGTMVKSKNADKFINEFFKDVEDMFNTFTKSEILRENVSTPSMRAQVGDYTQTEDGIIYMFPVAGCTKEDVSVEIEGNKVYVNAEFDDGEFNAEYTNTLTLNTEVYDEDNIEASVENGLLKLYLPFNTKDENNKGRRTVL